MRSHTIAKEIDTFTVADGQREVLVASGGASWGFVCSDEHCPARTCMGFDNPQDAGGGAVGHLRWHASGCRFCVICDSTLLPDEPGDRCGAGRHAGTEDEVPAAEVCGHCGDPFADVWGASRERYGTTRWCRGCVDRCHESTDFAHTCLICAEGSEPIRG